MARDENDLDRVNTFAEWCARCGMSQATGRRLIAAGDSPTITWLSPKRMGFRERHYVEPLDGRAKKPTKPNARLNIVK